MKSGELVGKSFTWKRALAGFAAAAVCAAAGLTASTIAHPQTAAGTDTYEPPALIETTIQASTPNPQPGDQVVVQFTVKNNEATWETVSMPRVEFTDGPTLTVTCDEGPIAKGQTATCKSQSIPYSKALEGDGSGVFVRTPAPANAFPIAFAWSSAIVVYESKLTATQSIDKTTAKPGETVNFEVKVTNEGTTKVKDVKVTDATVGDFVCDKTVLEAKQTATCKAAYIVKPTDAPKVVSQPKATAVDIGDDTVEATAPPCEVTVTIPLPALDVIQTVDKTSVKPGDTVTITLTVKNIGETTVKDLVATDTKLGSIVCEKTTLKVDEVTTCVKEYTTKAADKPSITLQPTVTGNDENGQKVTAKSNEVTISVLEGASLSHTAIVEALECTDVNDLKTCMPPATKTPVTSEVKSFDAGTVVRFVYEITNTGDVAVTNVSVTSTFAQNHVGGALSLDCDKTELSPGESTTCTTETHMLVKECVGEGTVDDVSIARAIESEVVAKKQAQAGAEITSTPQHVYFGLTKTDVVGPGKVQVTKTASTDSPKAGDTIRYTIVAKNIGETATKAGIKDELPNTVAYVGSSEGAVYDSATHTVTWPSANIAAGVSRTVWVDVQVLPTVAPGTQIVNSASALPEGGCDETTPGECAGTTTITVTETVVSTVTGTLPVTGSQTLPLLALAGLFVLAGLFLATGAHQKTRRKSTVK